MYVHICMYISYMYGTRYVTKHRIHTSTNYVHHYNDYIHGTRYDYNVGTYKIKYITYYLHDKTQDLMVQLHVEA